MDGHCAAVDPRRILAGAVPTLRYHVIRLAIPKQFSSEKTANSMHRSHEMGVESSETGPFGYDKSRGRCHFVDDDDDDDDDDGDGDDDNCDDNDDDDDGDDGHEDDRDDDDDDVDDDNDDPRNMMMATMLMVMMMVMMVMRLIMTMMMIMLVLIRMVFT